MIRGRDSDVGTVAALIPRDAVRRSGPMIRMSGRLRPSHLAMLRVARVPSPTRGEAHDGWA